MDNQSGRNYSKVAIAIVIGCVMIGASILATSYVETGRTQTVTQTVTAQTLTTQSVTTQTVTITTASMITTQVSTPTVQTSSYASNVVFEATKWPANFTVGQYSFSVAACGPPCQTGTGVNLTINLGSEVNFNVTYQGQTQMMEFGWPPVPPNNYPNALPSPSIGTAYGGGVTLNWFTNSTGLYVSISAKS